MAVPRQRKPTAAEMASQNADVDAVDQDDVEEVESPFVLDLMAEVEEVETFPVSLGDIQLDFPMAQHWSVTVISDFTAGRVVDAFKGMHFTQEELDALGELTGNQLMKLVEHINLVSGDSLGEARDSARSSRSTATRSKRTSNRSTRRTSGITSGRGSARAS